MKADTTNARPWFKAHVNLVLDDDRLGDLPGDYFKIFLQLYALCARHGEGAFIAKTPRQIAKRLAFSTESMNHALTALESVGLISLTPTGVTLCTWDTEQPEMSESERQRRSRASRNERNPALA